MKEKIITRMTTDHLREQLAAIVVEHKKNKLQSVEAKEALVKTAKEWMLRSEAVGFDAKFNVWNNVMADLVVLHNLNG